MSEPMPGPVRDALRVYLDQTSRRSLRQLAIECAQRSVNVSIATLKRWSTRYRWQQHVAEHDRAVHEQSMAMSVDENARALQIHFELIDSAKQQFYALCDPNNPNVTLAQRKRATKVTIPDYIRFLKAEEVLYKRLEWLESRRSAEPEKFTTTFTDEEVQVMMRALARHRHGLP
jgi:hypothetical protein